MSSNRSKFIVVVSFAQPSRDSNNKIQYTRNNNTDVLNNYAIANPVNTDPFSCSPVRFPPRNRMVDKAIRMFDTAGLTDEYNLCRYRGGNTTILALELKQRLSVKGGAIMFSGTTSDITSIDTLKATLVLLGLQDVRIYDYNTAIKAVVTEI